MFPAFWRFFDTKVFLGEFYAQDASGQYAAFLSSNTAKIDRQAAPEHGNDAYVWRIFYSYSDNAVYVMSKKHQYWCYKYTSTGLKNDTFTQISFDGSNTYYIYNKGAGKYLAYDETTKKYKFSNFSTADTLQWNINYTGDNFYTISPKKTPQFRFDIANAKWVITKANGGKEIVAGNYTIKTVSNGKYINAGSSYNLSLSYSSTKWNIAPYSYTINADNFYLLKAANGRILDLKNTYNTESNQIGAHPSVTGYATGQAWQFELGVDASGEYFLYIIPLNTRTRGLSVTGSTVCLGTSMSAVKLTRG